MNMNIHVISQKVIESSANNEQIYYFQVVSRKPKLTSITISLFPRCR